MTDGAIVGRLSGGAEPAWFAALLDAVQSGGVT